MITAFFFDFCKGSRRFMIFLFGELFFRLICQFLLRTMSGDISFHVVGYQMLKFSFLPSTRWSGRRKLEIPRFVCEKTFYKIGYAGFFPLFLFIFSFFFISNNRVKKITSWLTNFISKAESMKFSEGRKFYFLSPHFFPLSHPKDVWRQVPSLRLDFALPALTWWQNSFRRDLSSSVE